MLVKKITEKKSKKKSEIEDLVTAIGNGDNVRASKLLEKTIKAKVQNKIKSTLGN